MKRNEERVLLFKDLKFKDGLLHQKARLKWIRFGDANSKVFHRFINKRRKRNEISKITLNGEWKEEVDEVKKGVSKFFRLHFKSSSNSKFSLSPDFCQNKISEEENQLLVYPFSEEEVKAAIDSCDSFKSPVLDSFNFRFMNE